jgi:hypothetical protein
VWTFPISCYIGTGRKKPSYCDKYRKDPPETLFRAREGEFAPGDCGDFSGGMDRKRRGAPARDTAGDRVKTTKMTLFLKFNKKK